jgi:hypothetical protein
LYPDNIASQAEGREKRISLQVIAVIGTVAYLGIFLPPPQ